MTLPPELVEHLAALESRLPMMTPAYPTQGILDGIARAADRIADQAGEGCPISRVGLNGPTSQARGGFELTSGWV